VIQNNHNTTASTTMGADSSSYDEDACDWHEEGIDSRDSDLCNPVSTENEEDELVDDMLENEDY